MLRRGTLSATFCTSLGAFQGVFSWLQKATLGTGLPLPDAFAQFRGPLHQSGRFPRGFLVASESNVRQKPASKGALAGGFCTILAAFGPVSALSKRFSSGFRKQR